MPVGLTSCLSFSQFFHDQRGVGQQQEDGVQPSHMTICTPVMLMVRHVGKRFDTTKVLNKMMAFLEKFDGVPQRSRRNLRQFVRKNRPVCVNYAPNAVVLQNNNGDFIK